MKLAKFAFILACCAAPSFAGSVFIITVDASSLSPGTTGFIDLAFNGGFPATAMIDNFSNAGGSLNAPSIFTQGTVTGTLPGEVSLGNDNADYDEGITFGPTIQFQVTLAGVPGGSVGDVFTLSFINSTLDGALLTGNVNDGWLAQFQMDTAGNISATTFDNPSGGPSFATISLPEPSAGLLVGLALLVALVGTRLYRARTA
ncbi:MAG TPA: NF038129 family PEP-CTERM protein [Bryobacteraceae bacterium]|nr:NF038129 family PEP-CTERM protein [Bryobacteraceae bacterium]